MQKWLYTSIVLLRFRSSRYFAPRAKTAGSSNTESGIGKLWMSYGLRSRQFVVMVAWPDIVFQKRCFWVKKSGLVNLFQNR